VTLTIPILGVNLLCID